MNKEKAKKIISITVVALVIALVIVTIILAIVPKRFDDPVQDGYASISVYKSGVQQTYLYHKNAISDDDKKENEVFNKIQSLHKDSLKDSVLSAMFQGTGSFDVKVETRYVADVISSIAQESDTTRAIVFNFIDNVEFKLNGSVYKIDTEVNANTIKFNKAVIALNSAENFEECSMYLTETSNNCYYVVKFLAHEKDLYDYVGGLEFQIVK